MGNAERGQDTSGASRLGGGLLINEYFMIHDAMGSRTSAVFAGPRLCRQARYGHRSAARVSCAGLDVNARSCEAEGQSLCFI